MCVCVYIYIYNPKLLTYIYIYIYIYKIDLLYSTGNYIQYLVITYNIKEPGNEYTHINI